MIPNSGCACPRKSIRSSILPLLLKLMCVLTRTCKHDRAEEFSYNIQQQQQNMEDLLYPAPRLQSRLLLHCGLMVAPVMKGSLRTDKFSFYVKSAKSEGADRYSLRPIRKDDRK
ncbi:UNVERIFIED_CONTAM: hypothetical protein PYX00_009911 [Menopon gallinae]|uniref:Uncharacterized protein n=1 Tax=Menopon gallinae TaxID=328185 RepID=A0AAW2HDD4_9NEOP